MVIKHIHSIQRGIPTSGENTQQQWPEALVLTRILTVPAALSLPSELDNSEVLYIYIYILNIPPMKSFSAQMSQDSFLSLTIKPLLTTPTKLFFVTC